MLDPIRLYNKNDASRFIGRLPLILDLIFLVLLVAVTVAWIFDPLVFKAGSATLTMHANFKPWLALGLILIARIVLTRLLRRRGQPDRMGLLGFFVCRQALLALISICVMVGTLEWVLEKSGFAVQMAPVIFETTRDDGSKEQNRGYEDPELIWKFRVGENYDHSKINSLGYRDREVNPVKNPGTIRVICMGDSVTSQGHPPYSNILHSMLQVRAPTTNAWETFNMAVYGYSSAQGLKVFRTQTCNLQPDIVTIFYGWNDHWLEMQTDSNRMAMSVSQLHGTLYNQLKSRRSFMLLYNLIIRGNQGQTTRKEAGFRVPPDEYAQILCEFVEEIRAIGAHPLLITAPRREVQAGQGEFSDAATKIDFNAVHDQYVEITRKVAAQTGADLLDLHALAVSPEYDQYFSRDGIHFQQQGLELIAETIYNKLYAMVSRFS